MRVHTKLEYQWDGSQYVLTHEEGFEYDGPVALCDRAAQSEAKQAQARDAAVGNQEGAQANQIEGNLLPFYSGEMNAKHGFTPDQMGELLNYAESGSGAASGAAESEGSLNAARTRNTTGYYGSLSDIAHGEQKQDAGASEAIAASDIEAAKELNQQGAAGEAGLFGTNTSAMLSAYGLQNNAINTQIEAGKSGWFQNLLGFMSAGAQGAEAGAKVAALCYVAAELYGGWYSPKAMAVRKNLTNWAERSRIGRVAVAMYNVYGERLAKACRWSPLVRRGFRTVFDIVLKVGN